MNVLVFSAALLFAQTASPAFAAPGSRSVCAEPSCVQFTPSTLTNPATEFPVRAIFTHRGAVPALDPAPNDDAPAPLRHSKPALVGVTNTNA